MLAVAMSDNYQGTSSVQDVWMSGLSVQRPCSAPLLSQVSNETTSERAALSAAMASRLAARTSRQASPSLSVSTCIPASCPIISPPKNTIKEAAVSLLKLPEPTYISSKKESPLSHLHSPLSSSSESSGLVAAVLNFDSDMREMTESEYSQTMAFAEFYGVQPKQPKCTRQLALIKSWEQGRLQRWWIWHDKQWETILQQDRKRRLLRRQMFLNQLKSHPWMLDETENEQTPALMDMKLQEQEKRFKRKQLLEKLLESGEDISLTSLAHEVDEIFPSDEQQEAASYQRRRHSTKSSLSVPYSLNTQTLPIVSERSTSPPDSKPSERMKKTRMIKGLKIDTRISIPDSRRPSLQSPCRLKPVRRLSLNPATGMHRDGFRFNDSIPSPLPPTTQTQNPWKDEANNEHHLYAIAMLRLYQKPEDHRARLVDSHHCGEFEKLELSYWDRWSARDTLHSERTCIYSTLTELVSDINSALYYFDHDCSPEQQFALIAQDPTIKKKRQLRRRFLHRLKMLEPLRNLDEAVDCL